MKTLIQQKLKYMRKLAEVYSLDQISQQLVDQLPWRHAVVLIYQVSDDDARKFYIQQTIKNGWAMIYIRNLLINKSGLR